VPGRLHARCELIGCCGFLPTWRVSGVRETEDKVVGTWRFLKMKVDIKSSHGSNKQKNVSVDVRRVNVTECGGEIFITRSRFPM